jgi:hypothetical protein
MESDDLLSNTGHPIDLSFSRTALIVATSICPDFPESTPCSVPFNEADMTDVNLNGELVQDCQLWGNYIKHHSNTNHGNRQQGPKT